MPVSVAKGTSTIFGSRSIVNASILVFVANLALNMGAFAFHAIASRQLGVDAFGALYALISLYGLAVLPAFIFAPVVTKYSAEFGALHDDEHIRGLIGLIVRAFVILSVVYIVAGVALSDPLAAFLHVPTWEVPIVGVMSAVTTLSTGMRAFGQGVHAYGTYAWSMISEGATKVLALVPFILVGLTIFGAASAFLSSTVVGAAVIVIPLMQRYRNVMPAAIVLDWRRIFATTSGAAAMTLTTTSMGFADVLIVKHFFLADQAGLYSVASLCGKLLLYLLIFIPAILIPQATHRHARGERTRKLLWAAVVFIAVVAALGIVVFHYGGLLLLHVLTGRAYDAALPLLTPYAAAMAVLAMTSSLGSYGISTHRLGFVVPLFATTVGTLAAIAIVHPTLSAVVSELLIGNVVMMLSVVVPLGIQGMREARA